MLMKKLTDEWDRYEREVLQFEKRGECERLFARLVFFDGALVGVLKFGLARPKEQAAILSEVRDLAEAARKDLAAVLATNPITGGIK